jgi:hypothetical protein
MLVVSPTSGALEEPAKLYAATTNNVVPVISAMTGYAWKDAGAIQFAPATKHVLIGSVKVSKSPCRTISLYS